MVQARPSRLVTHQKMIGTLWMAYALAGLGNIVIAFRALNQISSTGETMLAEAGVLDPSLSFPVWAIAIFILIFLIVVASFLGGWALRRNARRARILLIALSFLALLNVPFGTALGVYTLWVLMPEESAREYEQAARAT